MKIRKTLAASMTATIVALSLVAAAQLPDPGMTIDKERTAIVITDPQNDFLSPDGVMWGVVGKSVEANHTVENIETLFKLGKKKRNSGLRVPALLLSDGPRLEVRRRARSFDAQGRHVRSQRRPRCRRL